jgi:hypothetical protein
MTRTFEITTHTRKILSKFLEDYTLEQLNKVPPGFSNNLIWNIGHIVVVQQMLVYKLSGLPMIVSDGMADKYKRGSRPETDVTQGEADEIKSLLFSTIEKTSMDFGKDIFKHYHEFTTMTGFHLTNAKSAMEFNNYHEGTHIGIMMSIRKFI